MAKETKREKVVALLLDRGCAEVESNSRKYRTFKSPNSADKYYFVGRKGALRFGKNVSNSSSLTRHLSL
jgi:hypothetical protein